MPLPTVAIVGRPNVGKSSLFNALAGRRISIVDPIPGVTRDRVSAVCEHEGVWFELIDTGGYGVEDRDNLTDLIEAQIARAVAGAAVILFVVDVREAIAPLDQRVAEFLRDADRDRRNRPVGSYTVCVVANKADVQQHEYDAGVFQRLGFGGPICVSALHGRNLSTLLDHVVELLRRASAAEGGPAVGPPPEPIMKLAIVGRQNVGKSTFINGLAREERVIVSEIPGTTRDAIDVRFERDGRAFLAIDTAGIRKKAKRDKIGLDFYSFVRAAESIRRADVVLFLIDATAKISEVDKKIARLLRDEFKPAVIVVNKWDLARGRASADDYGDYIARTLPHIAYAPLAFTTATDARNLHSTIELAQSLFNQARARVTTGQLNRALRLAIEQRAPSGAGRSGAAPRIYYATQVAVCPPTIVLFVNNPALLSENYRRFMARRLADALPFPEIPIRLLWRTRESRGPGRTRAVPARPDARD